MMTIEQFREADILGRAKKPKIFALIPPDRPATQEEIRSVEVSIGARLPLAYARFLSEFGGGTYGLVAVFSADADSDHYFVRRVNELAAHVPQGLLAFSDDQAGGVYAFRVEDGNALERVWYWNADGGLVETTFENALEYIAQNAYG